jgi:hypothetical protein
MVHVSLLLLLLMLHMSAVLRTGYQILMLHVLHMLVKLRMLLHGLGVTLRMLQGPMVLHMSPVLHLLEGSALLHGCALLSMLRVPVMLRVLVLSVMRRMHCCRHGSNSVVMCLRPLCCWLTMQWLLQTQLQALSCWSMLVRAQCCSRLRRRLLLLLPLQQCEALRIILLLLLAMLVIVAAMCCSCLCAPWMRPQRCQQHVGSRCEPASQLDRQGCRDAALLTVYACAIWLLLSRLLLVIVRCAGR